MEAIQTHAGVRIRWWPSSSGEGRWVAEHLLTRRRFGLSSAALLLLVQCFKPMPENVALEGLAARTRLGRAHLETLVSELKAKELLVSALDPIHRSVQEKMEFYRAVEWGAAWDYQLLIYDHPFVDYAAGGRRTDTERMSAYTVKEKDTNRSKHHAEVLCRLPYPRPHPELLPTAFGLAWTSPRRVRWSAEELLRLLSLAFGRTGAIPIPWAPSHPLYLKTSPSLGARHPIEAYVAPLDVPGLRPGWYHVCVADERLDMISEAGPGDVEELQRLFPTFAEPVRAIIVLTAYFDRSMFRYREPQTFRSLHLDAGHLCASVTVLAAGMGMAAELASAGNEPEFERQIGVRSLQEGIMAVIGIF